MTNCAISIAIGNFTYFLRFDAAGDGFAEGLIQNATIMTIEEADNAVKSLQSHWELSITALGKTKEVAA